MTKADLVEKVTAQIARTAGPLISKKDCARVVDSFLDAVKAALEIIDQFSRGTFPKALQYLPGTPAYQSTWKQIIAAAELRRGDVSLGYVSKLMHRKYPDTPLFRKVLQSIWHQVNHGQEIYVVGKILPDDTVHGGTGATWEHDAPLFFRRAQLSRRPGPVPPTVVADGVESCRAPSWRRRLWRRSSIGPR